jgi:hypothetical protein
MTPNGLTCELLGVPSCTVVVQKRRRSPTVPPKQGPSTRRWGPSNLMYCRGRSVRWTLDAHARDCGEQQTANRTRAISAALPQNHRKKTETVEKKKTMLVAVAWLENFDTKKRSYGRTVQLPPDWAVVDWGAGETKTGCASFPPSSTRCQSRRALRPRGASCNTEGRRSVDRPASGATTFFSFVCFLLVGWMIPRKGSN